LADAGGNVVETLAYDSFGNNGGSTRTRYTYTGRERDPDTGLLYYRARFYDPQLGRFISEDPIGFAGGDVNLYGYVWQNPLRHTDPSGLDGGWAPSDLADAADKYLEPARRFWTGLDPDAVDRNTAIHFVFNILGGFADLLRVGRGFGNYYYGRPCTVPADELFKDIGRVSGIALLLAGPAQGIANRGSATAPPPGPRLLPPAPERGVRPGPTVDPLTGQPIGRLIGSPNGPPMIEPLGGKTVAAGRGGVDTHTLYPNGSNYQRLNPVGHANNPAPHAHGHLPGTGPGRRGQGPSLDIRGNQVLWDSRGAHWPFP
jgi:RHS repeat-associated protein